MCRSWTFIYKKLVTGGLETFILRLCAFVSEHNVKCKIITNELSATMLEQLSECGTYVCKIKKWNFKNISKNIETGDIAIVFSIPIFAFLKEKFLYNKIILYCVHPYHLTLQDRKNNHTTKLKRIVFRYLIRTGNETGNIIYMDRTIRNAVFEFYGMENKEQGIVFHLPFEDTDLRKEWKDGENFLILTVCRADFPFKSYVIGLIDAVKRLKMEGYNIKLNIVSYGKDIRQIKERIYGQDFIQLIGEIEYDKLAQIYLNADINVGMGSTVIEASKYGIPSIQAKVNSPECGTCGFFHENPEGYGEYEIHEDGKAVYEQLKFVLDRGKKYLSEIGKRSRKIFEEEYIINGYYKKIEAHEIKGQKIIDSLLHRMIYSLYFIK